MGKNIMPPRDELLSPEYIRKGESLPWRNFFDNPTTVQFDHRVLVCEECAHHYISSITYSHYRLHAGNDYNGRNFCFMVIFKKIESTNTSAPRCECITWSSRVASNSWHKYFDIYGANRACISSSGGEFDFGNECFVARTRT